MVHMPTLLALTLLRNLTHSFKKWKSATCFLMLASHSFFSVCFIKMGERRLTCTQIFLNLFPCEWLSFSPLCAFSWFQMNWWTCHWWLCSSCHQHAPFDFFESWCISQKFEWQLKMVLLEDENSELKCNLEHSHCAEQGGLKSMDQRVRWEFMSMRKKRFLIKVLETSFKMGRGEWENPWTWFFFTAKTSPDKTCHCFHERSICQALLKC